MTGNLGPTPFTVCTIAKFSVPQDVPQNHHADTLSWSWLLGVPASVEIKALLAPPLVRIYLFLRGTTAPCILCELSTDLHGGRYPAVWPHFHTNSGNSNGYLRSVCNQYFSECLDFGFRNSGEVTGEPLCSPLLHCHASQMSHGTKHC